MTFGSLRGLNVGSTTTLRYLKGDPAGSIFAWIAKGIASSRIEDVHLWFLTATLVCTDAIRGP